MALKYEPVCVENIITCRPLKKYIEIEAFVGKIVREPANIIRVRIADNCIVGRIGNSITIHVTVLDIPRLNVIAVIAG